MVSVVVLERRRLEAVWRVDVISSRFSCVANKDLVFVGKVGGTLHKQTRHLLLAFESLRAALVVCVRAHSIGLLSLVAFLLLLPAGQVKAHGILLLS